nr:hypothetical protein Iba_chr15aCG0530 [Ipomoea batatas]
MSEGRRGGGNESLTREGEGFSLLGEESCMLSGELSTGCSEGTTGAGTKNFWVAGLIEGTAGEWNKFVALPPPLLKVSLNSSGWGGCHDNLPAHQVVQQEQEQVPTTDHLVHIVMLHSFYQKPKDFEPLQQWPNADIGKKN